MDILLKERICYTREKILSFWNRPHFQMGLSALESQLKDREKMAEDLLSISLFLEISLFFFTGLYCFFSYNSLFYFLVAQKLEGRVASDEDLKLSDTLRYYMRDSAAAKDLLYRRVRALADYENANKNLEKARTKNKDVPTVCLKGFSFLDYLTVIPVRK